ncbi:F0F1 ATP synthase subunit delta [Actinomyces sp. 2119]|uniref:F0F1 ATP synthase subunit delta n=1 Tax=Actinomyces sp. 2119 TaxID=2321393 RepID=UPI000E6D0C97|nr:F0F1 ATP synthase subunit delta [Actinomyces sp. 2119]RJF41437.1 F0F1 ATP synthase subunit delta [Actinomyces sp. 2119]
MNTGTAATRAEVRAAWAPVLAAAGPQGEELGRQILDVAHQVAASPLRGPLTDPGREGQDKADLASRLLRGRVDERVVELLCSMARRRWSQPVDIISALHDLGIEALLAGAYADGTVGGIEREIFGVLEQLAAAPELREALDPSRRTTTEARVQLAEQVFASHLSAPAMSLLRWCVRHRAEGGTQRNLRRVVERAAAIQHRTIADVVTAQPLSTQQEARLRSILTRRLGTDVELSTEVDPSVIGGMRVTVKDYVLDRTVASTIADLRQQVTG